MEPRILAGRYELTRKIGSGGMGTVWSARDTTLGREVAVKVLHEGLAQDTAFGERFRLEARNAARLAHPNVAAVYDTGDDEGVPFIVMELVDGESLHARIQREGPLPVRDTVSITRRILAALGHAHDRGLVHRDMKPANVLLTGGGGVKVVDFGIAKVAGGADITRTGALLGTAAYLSPEQAMGHEATHRSDLYALGCLMHAALIGEPPFGGDTPVAVAMRHTRDAVPPIRSRRPDAPPEVEAVVMRALEKEPSRRYASAAEMAAALEAAGPEATLPAGAPTVVMAASQPTTPLAGTEVLPRARAPARKTGPFLGIATAVLLAALVVWLLAAYLSNRGPGFLQAPLPTTTLEPEPTPSPTPTATPATPAPPDLELPGVTVGGSNPTPEPTETPVVEDTPPPDETPLEFPFDD
jgi:serine/threonine-protein kinase